MESLKTRLDPQLLCETLKNCLPQDREAYPLHEPVFEGKEWDYVKRCLDTRWVSTAGEFVSSFEKKIMDITGSAHAHAVVNGTAALHMSLLLSKVEPGDEVLVPDLTFVATANAVSYCHATPHFVDCEAQSLGVDAEKLDKYLLNTTQIKNNACINRVNGKIIKALIVTHVFGRPADLDALAHVAKKYRIVLIEDAAESLGSFYKGRHTGLTGQFAALSFNGNKIVTSGGGGAILTQDTEIGKHARHLTTTAKRPHAWEFFHDYIGYNYRLPNLNAALGLAQLEQLDSFLAKKRKLAERYEKALKSVDGVRFFSEPSYAKSNFWLNAIILDAPFKNQRDEILECLHRAKIQARPIWKLMHKLPMFAACPKMDLSTAEDLENRIINIPSSADL